MHVKHGIGEHGRFRSTFYGALGEGVHRIVEHGIGEYGGEVEHGIAEHGIGEHGNMRLFKLLM